MRTDKIRKYLIPNIPYLFILWAFLKLGTAYRLAAGNDFAHKLIGLGQTIGPAFADFAPGRAPLDWLVGIVGAVGFRLLIYFKSKNAKKFRRDAEYGSARWGTEKDIKPFVDPKFENNVILTGTEFLTMNTRPKIPANARFFGIFRFPLPVIRGVFGSYPPAKPSARPCRSAKRRFRIPEGAKENVKPYGLISVKYHYNNPYYSTHFCVLRFLTNTTL